MRHFLLYLLQSLMLYNKVINPKNHKRKSLIHESTKNVLVHCQFLFEQLTF